MESFLNKKWLVLWSSCIGSMKEGKGPAEFSIHAEWLSLGEESVASGKMGTRHVLQLDFSQQEEKKIPR